MEEEDRGEPSIREITVPRVAWDRAIVAFVLIRRLVEAVPDPATPPVDGYCIFCRAFLIGDRPHATGCPYVAAKALFKRA